MDKTLIRIGPDDNGARMTLDDFEDAVAEEGYLYELARGVIEVADIPDLPHGYAVGAIRKQLETFWGQNPEAIHYIAGGAECKLLLPGMESERHPDLAVYLNPPPKLEPVWRYWTPEIVFEVVSKGQEKRDYEDKREEYLVAGVREYWILDRPTEKVLILQRTGDQWREVSRPLSGTYPSAALSDFSLNFDKVSGIPT